MPRVVEVTKQLVGIKVLVRVEDMTDKNPPRLGQLLTTDLEKFAKFLHRRIRYRHGSQEIPLRFPNNPRSADQFAVLSYESFRSITNRQRRFILALERAVFQSASAMGRILRDSGERRPELGLERAVQRALFK